MNGHLFKWLPFVLAVVAIAVAWGANTERQEALADNLGTHIDRPAHVDAMKTFTRLEAASARVDERTSRILEAQKQQTRNTRDMRRMIQRIMERQIR